MHRISIWISTYILPLHFYLQLGLFCYVSLSFSLGMHRISIWISTYILPLHFYLQLGLFCYVSLSFSLGMHRISIWISTYILPGRPDIWPDYFLYPISGRIPDFTAGYPKRSIQKILHFFHN
jgi:hypothetical protein